MKTPPHPRPKTRTETSRQSTAGHRGATSNPTTWPQLSDRLQELLDVGDFEGARDQLSLLEDDVEAVVRALEDKPAQLKAATLIAEILFAFGEDATAQRLLEPLAKAPAELLASSLDARQKLQIAEYHHSFFRSEEASRLAGFILADANKSQSPEAIGVCRYYLARFSVRQSQYAEASEHCMRGLEVVLSADKSEGDRHLRWETGRLLRVRGTALGWLARLQEGTAVLYLAAWLLKQTKGSDIYVGDAYWSLGRLLRSLGPSRYDDAKKAFEGAREKYKHHDLKRARALTDLARLLLNIGLEREAESKSEDAAMLFLASDSHLDDARSISEQNSRKQNSRGSHRPPVWVRQDLDVMIWRSWLHQEARPLLKPDEALLAAREAVRLAELLGQGSPEYIDAALVMGHCALMQERFTEAHTHLERAAQLARIPKLKFHAYLCLAQYECRANADPAKAHELYQRARTVSDNAGEEAFGGYLRNKAKVVKAEIDNLRREPDDFTFTKAALLDTTPGWSPLKVLRSKAEMWAIDVIGKKQPRGSVADTLQVSKGTIRDIRIRHEALMRGDPPPDTKPRQQDTPKPSSGRPHRKGPKTRESIS